MKVRLTEYERLEACGGGIYKITSPSNKEYIGKTLNLTERFKTYNRLYCKGQTKLYNSLIKHGIENHFIEILEKDDNPIYLSHKEACYISEVNDSKKLNIKTGDSGGNIKYGLTICILLYGKNLDGYSLAKLSREYGIHQSTVKKLILRVGKPVVHEYKMSDEHKEVLRQISIGRTPWIKGRTHSAETRLKLSKLHENRIYRSLGFFITIPEKALDEFGNLKEVIPKKYIKMRQTDDWKVQCNKLYNRQIYLKNKEKNKSL